MRAPLNLLATLLCGAAVLPAVALAQAPTQPAAPTTADGGIESRIRLRPIDRASVRVLQITGASAYTFEGRVSRVRRAVSLPDAVHGTGVVIGPDGLVLTAAHVVRGGDVLAVLRPGVQRRVWPGAFLTMGIGGSASYLFVVYAKELARFALFYGGLAAVAIALFWLWIWCAALLVGAELNAQLEGREDRPLSRVLP